MRWFREMILIFILVGMMVPQTAAQPDRDFNQESAITSPAKRERIRQRIETLRMWELTRALDLDEATAAKLFPLLNRYAKKRQELEKGIQADLSGLREALKNRDQERIRELLDQLEDRHRALQQLNDEERAELKKVLTLEQQAQYILFQQRFNREIRRLINEARRRRLKKVGRGPADRPPASRRPPSPPDRPLE